MWKPSPNFITGLECWIIAGGAHHTTLSFNANADVLRDFARIMQIEFIHLNDKTEQYALEKELMLGDIIWR